MVEVGFDGMGTPHNNYINSGQFGLKKDIAVYEYDLEKAKAELELSGFKPGELTFHVMTDKEYKKNMALVLQADLSQIGINLVIDEMETAALKSVLNDAALNYELCIYQWTDADGTDFTVRNMYGSSIKDGVLKKNGSNRAVLTDAALNEMIDAALVEQDKATREQMYFDIEDYLNEIVPIVPFCTSYINIGTGKDVTGAVWRPTAKHDYRLICVPLD
jgi:peptide/nickel transport system substrate-binding protein